MDKFIYAGIILVLVLLTADFALGKKSAKVYTAAGCLANPGNIEVRCPKSSDKISINSVHYAYEEDCTTGTEENSCTQVSQSLSTKAQAACDGKTRCSLGVVSIPEFNKDSLNSGPQREVIDYKLPSCGYGKSFITDAQMTAMLIRFECTEYQFCNEISDTVKDLTIASEGYPVKAVANPTCGCSFECSDMNQYTLTGYFRCNGSMSLISEETNTDGETETLVYPCKDKLGADFVYIDAYKGHKNPYKIKVKIDAETSDEEVAYEIRWYNKLKHSEERKFGLDVKVNCEAGSLYLKYSVRLILMIVLPVCGAILIALIVIYCICKKRRRKSKEWRARHVKLPKAAHNDAPVMIDSPIDTPLHRSLNSSLSSIPNTKNERVDPEGNVDDIGEYAAMLAKKNEELRRKELERRQAYRDGSYLSYNPPPARTPTVDRYTMHHSRRTQSIGSLRTSGRRAQSYGNLRSSDKRSTLADNLDTPKPLAYSKSASQSRSSVRSLKRRAPQPPGPPQVPVPVHNSTRTPMYASSTASVNRSRHRQNSQPSLTSPTYSQPYTRDNPYSTPQLTNSQPPASPQFSDNDPNINSENEEMPIMRPSTRPPKPPTAPKPRLPPKHRSASSRYPQARPPKGVTPSDLRDLQHEMGSESD